MGACLPAFGPALVLGLLSSHSFNEQPCTAVPHTVLLRASDAVFITRGCFACDALQQKFEEATTIYLRVSKRVERGDFAWAALPPETQREMNGVVKVWKRAGWVQGHVQALHNLGYLYEAGQGVPRDQKEAVRCWTKAAELGDLDAQYNLGVMYAKGRGIEKNEAKAVELLSLAADKGDANAQLNLGIM